jgi:hypothetical protein
MGRVLQIRVAAQTFRPEDVEETWPTLTNLAWPEPRPADNANRGVLDLADDLLEQLTHGDWPDERKESLRAGIAKAMDIRRRLETALSDWDPKAADRMSYDLEDVLDSLEKKAADA